MYNVLQTMLRRAKAQKEVTLDMVLRKAGANICARTTRDKLKRRNIGFRKLKEKPLQEKGDRRARKVRTDAHKHRSTAQWVTSPQAIIDNKSFAMVLNLKSREWAARRSARGAYQNKGSQPTPWLVKPKGGENKAKFPMYHGEQQQHKKQPAGIRAARMADWQAAGGQAGRLAAAAAAAVATAQPQKLQQEQPPTPPRKGVRPKLQ